MYLEHPSNAHDFHRMTSLEPEDVERFGGVGQVHTRPRETARGTLLASGYFYSHLPPAPCKRHHRLTFLKERPSQVPIRTTTEDDPRNLVVACISTVRSTMQPPAIMGANPELQRRGQVPTCISQCSTSINPNKRVACPCPRLPTEPIPSTTRDSTQRRLATGSSITTAMASSSFSPRPEKEDDGDCSTGCSGLKIPVSGRWRPPSASV